MVTFKLAEKEIKPETVISITLKATIANIQQIGRAISKEQVYAILLELEQLVNEAVCTKENISIYPRVHLSIKED